jgi:D-galactarolactone cycloisomerase
MTLALRSLVGADIGLMVDINQGYTARGAIASARRMEEAELLWIEEPVLPEDIDGYRAVATAVPVAIAGGEALGSLAAFRDFLAAGTFSILQPDMTVCGGYTGFAKVAALAAAYDLPVMPHVFGTAVHQRSALQMAALLPSRRGGGPAEFPYVEIDATDNRS